VFQLGRAGLQRSKEEASIAQLIFVGRISEEGDCLLVRGLFVSRISGEIQAFERLVIGKEHAIGFSPLMQSETMAKIMAERVGFESA
jgi:hypothetical protein